jgi:hypothetical protein
MTSFVLSIRSRPSGQRRFPVDGRAGDIMQHSDTVLVAAHLCRRQTPSSAACQAHWRIHASAQDRLRQTVVGMAPAGDSVALEVWHDGRSLTAGAVLTPAEQLTAQNGIGKSSHGIPGHLGLEVRPLTSDEREQAGVSTARLVQ